MNVIIARQEFSAHLIYLPFQVQLSSEYVFWSKNAQICLKLRHFY